MEIQVVGADQNQYPQVGIKKVQSPIEIVLGDKFKGSFLKDQGLTHPQKVFIDALSDYFSEKIVTLYNQATQKEETHLSPLFINAIGSLVQATLPDTVGLKGGANGSVSVQGVGQVGVNAEANIDFHPNQHIKEAKEVVSNIANISAKKKEEAIKLKAELILSSLHEIEDSVYLFTTVFKVILEDKKETLVGMKDYKIKKLAKKVNCVLFKDLTSKLIHTHITNDPETIEDLVDACKNVK